MKKYFQAYKIYSKAVQYILFDDSNHNFEITSCTCCCIVFAEKNKQNLKEFCQLPNSQIYGV